MFILDVVRARKGDCLILHFGSEDDPHIALIDGGHFAVFMEPEAFLQELVRRVRPLALTR